MTSSERVVTAVRYEVSRWKRLALERRQLTQHDAASDALEHCAEELEKRLDRLVHETDEMLLSPEEYGELYQICGQTARNWCRAGKLEHERVGKKILIPRNAQRRKAP